VLAAFYEASGASTCNHGIDCPRRNRCAPISKIAVNLQKDNSSFPLGKGNPAKSWGSCTGACPLSRRSCLARVHPGDRPCCGSCDCLCAGANWSQISYKRKNPCL